MTALPLPSQVESSTSGPYQSLKRKYNRLIRLALNFEVQPAAALCIESCSSSCIHFRQLSYMQLGVDFVQSCLSMRCLLPLFCLKPLVSRDVATVEGHVIDDVGILLHIIYKLLCPYSHFSF